MNEKVLVYGVLGTVGICSYGIGIAVGTIIQKKKNDRTEKLLAKLVVSTNELLKMGEKYDKENKILKAKIKEFGCL